MLEDLTQAGSGFSEIRVMESYESNIVEALKEIRRVSLEADVNFKVADFISGTGTGAGQRFIAV
jgi:signal recognition particle GTPase